MQPVAALFAICCCCPATERWCAGAHINLSAHRSSPAGKALTVKHHYLLRCCPAAAERSAANRAKRASKRLLTGTEPAGDEVSQRLDVYTHLFLQQQLHSKQQQP
jgi:hypothetical protein